MSLSPILLSPSLYSRTKFHHLSIHGFKVKSGYWFNDEYRFNGFKVKLVEISLSRSLQSIPGTVVFSIVLLSTFTLSSQLSIDLIDTLCSHVLQVGIEVYLKSTVNSMEVVAKARVRSLDPDEVVGGEEIGPEWCEAHVLVAIKRRERLVRPYGMFITIEDALGATVAWPCPFVSVVPEDET